MDKMFWIAVEMDCFRPNATKVLLIEDERQAMLLGSQYLVFEKLPGIKEPKLIPYERRQLEAGV